MTRDERREARLEFLLVTAERVLRAFKSGHHPTFQQLDKLEAAIEAHRSMLLCGHMLMEECDCVELERGI